MSKEGKEGKHHKKMKQLRSKVHGLTAHYAGRLKKQEEEKKEIQRAALKPGASPEKAKSEAPQDVDVNDKVNVMRKRVQERRANAMKRFTMATGGGGFQGR